MSTDANIAHLLVRQSVDRPIATAIIEPRGRITFAELDELSARAARLLVDSGICAGDRVLIFVPMSIDLYAALIGVFRIGAVATFLDPSAGRAHIEHCCKIAKPAALIATTKAHLLRLLSPGLRRIRRKFALPWPVPGAAQWARAHQCEPFRRIQPRVVDDPALMTFTSGSTGKPKAALRTHGFLAVQNSALTRAIHLQPGEIDLATLPIFALANLAAGVTTVIPNADLRRPDAIDPRPVLTQIGQHRMTRAAASPAFFERLLAGASQQDHLGSFRQIYTGGAPVFPRLMRRLQQAMPQARIIAVYGSTEAEPIAHIAWDEISEADLDQMLSGAGLLAGGIVPEISLRILPNDWGKPVSPMTPEAFAAYALPHEQLGEIVVHGDHVLRGYLDGVGNEQTKFQVGDGIWHRTGDVGYLDAGGRLWLLGRAEARVQDERGCVYPFAVECAASQLPAVRRSAFIAHEGRRLLIVESDCEKQADIGPAIRARLGWAHIDRVCHVDHIPVDKRHNAKVDYPALRELIRRRAL